MDEDSRRRGELIQVLDPKDTNVYGNIFGGVIMSMMDKAAAIVAWRYARLRVLTAGVDRIAFHSPIQVGEVVRASSTIVYVGRSSMEVEVVVSVQNLITGEDRIAASGFLTMVAVDDVWRPTEIPGWQPVAEEDVAKWREAAERRKLRGA